MRLEGIRPGDRVECNVRGRRFWAEARELEASGRLRIIPPAGITYYRVTARQVISHRRGGGGGGTIPMPGVADA